MWQVNIFWSSFWDTLYLSGLGLLHFWNWPCIWFLRSQRPTAKPYATSLLSRWRQIQSAVWSHVSCFCQVAGQNSSMKSDPKCSHCQTPKSTQYSSDSGFPGDTNIASWLIASVLTFDSYSVPIFWRKLRSIILQSPNHSLWAPPRFISAAAVKRSDDRKRLAVYYNWLRSLSKNYDTEQCKICIACL